METEIRILEFNHLKDAKEVTHGIFTRTGGISTQPYDTLNIGVNSGDEATAIATNRKLIIMKMGMKPLVFLNQVHGSEVKVLKQDEPDFSINFEPGKETYTADAIVTDMKGVVLVIQVADCQSVMMYDPVKKVVSNVHSGWRGSIGNIVGKCVDHMVKVFGCDPADILAGISPSLGPCCAEFVNYRDEIPEALWQYKLDGKDYFDFWQMSRDQLEKAGLKPDNIENMQICTKCNTDRFYSYRAEKTTGRFACVISLG